MLQRHPLYAYIPARDVTRARQFYEGTLGLTPKEEVEGGVVYAFPGGTAAYLYPTPHAGTSQASQAFWQVDDIEREVAELKARGVGFEDYDVPGERSPSGVLTAGGAKVAWFKDPDGNILALVEELRRRQPLRNRMRSLFAKALVPGARLRPTATAASATGALALGAFAIGALAFGALAIGRLAVGRARIGRLEIGELRVRDVHFLPAGRSGIPG
jgi:predicted enzyme related to lactoylglutathione lyase